MIKNIVSKKVFLTVLEEELLLNFSIEEAMEILDDYKVFFEEKELEGLLIEDILNDFGEPKEIIKGLINDRTSKPKLLTKMIAVKRRREFIVIVWIFISLLLVKSLEKGNASLLFNIVLVCLNTGLFWYLFAYQKLKRNAKVTITSKENKRISLYQIATLGIVYFNILVIMFAVRNLSETPILSSLPQSMIGPFIHYQIVVSIILCFFFLYFVLIKYSNKILHFSSIIFWSFSIIVLSSLNRALGSLDSIILFDKYIIQQLLFYSVVVMVLLGIKVKVNKMVRRIS